MSPPLPRACGSWASPISANKVASEGGRVGEIRLEGTTTYWSESRPAEAGRSVIVRATAAGSPQNLTPWGFDVRSRVHEYGGGAFAVHRSVLYFANLPDQAIYRQHSGHAPERVYRGEQQRFADLVVDATRQRLICVLEDHSGAGEPCNSLVAIPLARRAHTPRVLARGFDFYASPALSRDGNRLAWLCWNHPEMPWSGAQLWHANLAADGTLGGARHVAGGTGEAVFQPQWHPSGHLHFVSDRNGWWNHYRLEGTQVRCLLPTEAEFGLPQWAFALSTYDFTGRGDLITAYCEGGTWRLAKIVLGGAGARAQALTNPYTELSDVRCQGERVVFRAGSPHAAPAIVALELASNRFRTLGFVASDPIDEGYLSTPAARCFPSEAGGTAHAFYYPPHNADFRPLHAERPPLLINCHGGPTGAASTSLDLGIQFWTSRGFAVVDVNYRGSTGYGRRYRDALAGQWGLLDVSDCLSAARSLVQEGLADARRTAIRGRSSGGYTALAALIQQQGTLQAGVSYYGISDLERLARDTHKFESHYLDWLVGPWPHAVDTYRLRSPLPQVHRLSVPVLFFQGLDDPVVPPSQTERMVQALWQRRRPAAYVAFAGERHGLRKAANIRRALEAELYFYSRLFGFPLAEEIEPIEITHLG